MGIDTIIHCLERSDVTGCFKCPHYVNTKDEIESIRSCRLSRISEAQNILKKYQKIEELLSMDDENHRRTIKIAELKGILEDESV